MQAADGLTRVHAELRETTRSLEKAASPDEMIRLTERQGHLRQAFEGMRGYALEAQARKILTGLGFREEDFCRPIEQFSRGWMMRVAMARILLSNPDLVFLDEPTNHLDVESMIWMEDFLKEKASTLILVSHDRAFLNNIVNRIVDIDGGRLVSYRGNYDFYEKEKQKRLQIQRATFENQQEKIRQIEGFIARNRVRKDRARQVQSRIKLLERMERIEPPIDHHTLDFDFPQPPRAPKILIELTEVSKSYETETIYDRVSLSIQRGDRIAFLGPNGAGKTTLMKILKGEVDFEGERRVAAAVQLGVFSEELMDQLLPGRTVLEELESVAGSRPQGHLRSLLGAFLFRGDDVFKRVSVLSGGEKSRLLLCKTLLQPANLLLLDEPTNHLDIPSRKILEGALQRYQGTLCLISHDRRLIDRVSNKVLVIQNQTAEIYPGNFDDFQAIWRQRESAAHPTEKEAFPRRRSVPGQPARTRKRAEAEWRNRFFREVTPLKECLSDLERRIEEKTGQLEEITDQLRREDVLQNPQRVGELSEIYRAAKTQVASWTRQWESTALELEELEERFKQARPRQEDA
jgi:ATP-binding cassette subfamily F protein 3